MQTKTSPTERASRNETIRRMYLERYTDREIAAAVGLHRVTVTRIRLALGVTRDDRPAVSL